MKRFGRGTERAETEQARDEQAEPASPEALHSEAPIPGERHAGAVRQPSSLQARISNLLAVGLMGSLGVGFLVWYYAHSFSARTTTRSAEQASAAQRAKGDVVLRPLGRVDPPAPPATGLQALLGAAPPEPLEPSKSNADALPSRTVADAQAVPATKSPEELRLERLLGGPVFAAPANASSAGPPAGREDATPAAARAGAEAGEMAGLLQPDATPAAAARVLPTQRLLMPKGAFLDCTLETAIDSSLAGMTTCILATDAFSADGSVVLLERGTKLVGETRGQVHEGAARIFVLWTEARTPNGIVVPLASPGTDELGRSGLPGDVDRHFFERFGAAILVSVIDGAVQAAAQSQSGNNGTVVVNPSTTSQVMTDVLNSTINIPPTVRKPQGDRIQVLVARDLDFRPVYELRARAGP
jgi:type IV secretion system protein VirB10